MGDQMRNIDHMDAIAELDAAYEFLTAFWEMIEANDGDHPLKEPLFEWLARYEMTEDTIDDL